MSKLTNLAIAIFFFTTFLGFSQYKPDAKKVTITGTILEKGTESPLEYATVVFQDATKPEVLTGGVTDFDGKFNFEVKTGTYNIRFEFISFKTVELKNQTISSNKNFGKC